MGKVTVIPAKTNVVGTNSPTNTTLRVAAYARVSSEKDEQEHSYEAQINYYTSYITNHPGWEFAGMYADEGKTGTTTKNRLGFQQLMADVAAGKLDLVLCKSISRFGRNTRDILEAVETFRKYNVECIWEKENVRALNASGDLLFTIYSAFAQEESRSISENVKEGIKYNFQVGVFSLPYAKFLGYEKGENGLPKIVESEAKIIRDIYAQFLSGKAPSAIAKDLTSRGIPTPGGKEKWATTTVISILTNEKYCGRAILRKRYVPNFLDHKLVANEGQREKYFIENSHKGIVSKDIFDMVQYEMERRAKLGTKRTSTNYLTNYVFCKDCGGNFGKKVHHSNSKYRKEIYRCNECYSQETKCSSARLTEEQIEGYFLQALNRVATDYSKREVVETALEFYSDNDSYETKLLNLQDKYNALAGEIQKLIDLNAATLNVEHYQERYDALIEEYTAIKDEIERVGATLTERKQCRNKLLCYLNNLDKIAEPMVRFDKYVFCNFIEKVMVGKDDIDFYFADGSTITVDI